MQQFTVPDNYDELLESDWLVTNGLGGYASGTLAGINNWKYHGLLVSAEKAPFGRMVMLKRLGETITRADGTTGLMNGAEVEEEHRTPSVPVNLVNFRLDYGLPIWQYRIGDLLIERSIVMPHRQNSVYVRYRVLECDAPVELSLRPYVRFRQHEANDEGGDRLPFALTLKKEGGEISAGPDLPVMRVRLSCEAAVFSSEKQGFKPAYFSRDADRGGDPHGSVWSPGHYRIRLEKGSDIAFIASTEGWSAIYALKPEEAFSIEIERRKYLLGLAPASLRTGFDGDLVLAADHFLIEPAGRLRDKAMAAARGDQVRAVIAGYHWFTDWGRDTMISLEGLTLTTGRFSEARFILRSFGQYVRDGLIPNFFPDGKEQGVYHTADASLWYFHALGRYLSYTNDRETLRILLPQLREIIDFHLDGTRYGIRIDPADGLMTQGEEGYQLSWMDAKVDGWVVTPRRGKAVELNGLWYNALCLMSQWLADEGDTEGAAALHDHADRAKKSFNQRFWYEKGGYLYDVIDGEDGDDHALRPNQLLAFSLDHPVLAPERCEKVLDTVRKELFTPVGMRTLSRGHADYKTHYFGDLRARDAAYHQGTVWPWLIGPFVDAWLKARPDDLDTASAFLEGFLKHRNEGCIGSINEIFDAEEPYRPRGCISQAWSVAEVLRCRAMIDRRRSGTSRENSEE